MQLARLRLLTANLQGRAQNLQLKSMEKLSGADVSSKWSVRRWLRDLWIPSSMELFAQAEEQLLSLSGTHLTKSDVQLKDGNHIHTVEAGHRHRGKQTPLVMCHGFGMGVGGWYLNYRQLSHYKHMFAIDWLGMGNSSRPKFPCKDVEDTEDWFVESLDQWREKNNLDKMILCGHSLGGYLATAYTLKYPDRVEHLILASPAGVNKKPDIDPYTERLQTMSPVRRLLLQRVVGMWASGYTPQDIVRFLGPLGPKIMNGYAQNRFTNTEIDRAAVGQYLYHNAAGHGSGEYSLSKLLLPFAYAKAPLCERLPAVKVPTTFIYGDTDWMDPRHADAVVPHMKVPAKVVRVSRAGHQLFLDNPSEFNEAVLSACGFEKSLPKRKPEQKLSWLTPDDVSVSIRAPAA